MKLKHDSLCFIFVVFCYKFICICNAGFEDTVIWGWNLAWCKFSEDTDVFIFIDLVCDIKRILPKCLHSFNNWNFEIPYN